MLFPILRAAAVTALVIAPASAQVKSRTPVSNTPKSSSTPGDPIERMKVDAQRRNQQWNAGLEKAMKNGFAPVLDFEAIAKALPTAPGGKKPQTNSPWTHGSNGRSVSVGVLASNRPAAHQIPLQAFQEIVPGKFGADVVTKLGKPPGRVNGLSDSEQTWTYVAEGGGSVRIKLRNNAVTGVLLPE